MCIPRHLTPATAAGPEFSHSTVEFSLYPAALLWPLSPGLWGAASAEISFGPTRTLDVNSQVSRPTRCATQFNKIIARIRQCYAARETLTDKYVLTADDDAHPESSCRSSCGRINRFKSRWIAPALRFGYVFGACPVPSVILLPPTYSPPPQDVQSAPADNCTAQKPRTRASGVARHAFEFYLVDRHSARRPEQLRVACPARSRAMTRKSSAPLSQSFVFPVYIVRVTPQRLENSDAFFGSVNLARQVPSHWKRTYAINHRQVRTEHPRFQEGAAIDRFQLISTYNPAKVTGDPTYFAANLGAQPHPSARSHSACQFHLPPPPLLHFRFNFPKGLAPLLASKFPRPVKENVQDPQNSMGGSTAVGVVLVAVDNSREDP
ncbi:hypothetical protein DFH09DRAFT_1107236 [Mycena vulgaris]|nr:hypothetical protein DFH09DRAFT_1107236 [Mycena vulgaris]